jgi:hypothetical protein
MRRTRVEVNLLPELVGEIDRCRGAGQEWGESRSVWVERELRKALGYRVDVEAVVVDDEAVAASANVMELSVEQLGLLHRTCVTMKTKPADVLRSWYEIGDDEELVIRLGQ